jgi:hypothetical protein
MCYMLEGGGSKSFSKAKGWIYGEPDAANDLLNVLTETSIKYDFNANACAFLLCLNQPLDVHASVCVWVGVWVGEVGVWVGECVRACACAHHAPYPNHTVQILDRASEGRRSNSASFRVPLRRADPGGIRAVSPPTSGSDCGWSQVGLRGTRSPRSPNGGLCKRSALCSRELGADTVFTPMLMRACPHVHTGRNRQGRMFLLEQN